MLDLKHLVGSVEGQIYADCFTKTMFDLNSQTQGSFKSRYVLCNLARKQTFSFCGFCVTLHRVRGEMPEVMSLLKHCMVLRSCYRVYWDECIPLPKKHVGLSKSNLDMVLESV